MHAAAKRHGIGWLGTVITSLLLLPIAADAADGARHAELLDRLHQFVIVEDAFADSPAADRQGWLACDRLSRRIRDDQLADLEAFAVRPEAKNVRWMLAKILVQRKRFDGAAHVMVRALTEEPENRDYQMWKWWEYHFKDRPDFDEMNWRIGEAFLHQFEKGTAEERLAISETFGKGRLEAEMSPSDFRKTIRLPEHQPAPATKPSPSSDSP